MDDHTSFIGAHERSPREMAEEGVSLPAEAAVLTFRDRRRDRRVILILPSRAAAEAWAAEALRRRLARKDDVKIRPLEAAVA